MILPGMPRPMPMNLRGGFQPLVGATWNPSDRGTGITLSNGNLTVARSSSGHSGVRATSWVPAGKFFWEVTIDVNSSNNNFLGIGTSAASLSSFLGSDANGWSYNPLGVVRNANSIVASGLNTYGAGDVIGIAVDMENLKLHFAKNGNWQASSDPDAGVGGFDIALDEWFPMLTMTSSGDARTANFSGPFTYL